MISRRRRTREGEELPPRRNVTESSDDQVTVLLLFEIDIALGASLILHLCQRKEGDGELQIRASREGAYLGTPSWDASLDAAEGRALLSQLSAIRIGMAPDFAMGLDGTTYRLTLGSGWNELHLTWWVRLPAAWGSLAPFLTRLLELAGPQALDFQLDVE